jgi:hypothetical protein
LFVVDCCLLGGLNKPSEEAVVERIPIAKAVTISYEECPTGRFRRGKW